MGIPVAGYPRRYGDTRYQVLDTARVSTSKTERFSFGCTYLVEWTTSGRCGVSARQLNKSRTTPGGQYRGIQPPRIMRWRFQDVAAFALVALPAASSFCFLPSSRLCVSTTPFRMIPGTASIRAKPEGPCASKEVLLKMQSSPGDGRSGEGEVGEPGAWSTCYVKASLMESSSLSSPLVSASLLVR